MTNEASLDTGAVISGTVHRQGVGRAIAMRLAAVGEQYRAHV